MHIVKYLLVRGTSHDSVEFIIYSEILLTMHISVFLEALPFTNRCTTSQSQNLDFVYRCFIRSKENIHYESAPTVSTPNEMRRKVHDPDARSSRSKLMFCHRRTRWIRGRRSRPTRRISREQLTSCIRSCACDHERVRTCVPLTGRRAECASEAHREPCRNA